MRGFDSLTEYHIKVVMNTVDIYEYILLSLEERQFHLNLDAECIILCEKKSTSTHHAARGILAWNLKTTIPSGMKIHLCHACNNKMCCNPYHLYWGTPKENHQDQFVAVTYKPFKVRMVNKYGEEEYKKMMRQNASKGGKANRGNSKSDNHRQKLSESFHNKMP